MHEARGTCHVWPADISALTLHLRRRRSASTRNLPRRYQETTSSRLANPFSGSKRSTYREAFIPRLPGNTVPMVKPRRVRVFRQWRSATRKRPTRDSILLPVVLVILLLLLIVATRPVLAQSLPSQPPSPATPIEVGLRGNVGWRTHSGRWWARLAQLRCDCRCELHH